MTTEAVAVAPRRVPRTRERVLLIYPSVFDVRLPWAKWQQPALLLRMSSYFKSQRADVKLIDALESRCEGPLKKKRTGFSLQDNHLDAPVAVPMYRFGITESQIDLRLRQLRRDNWIPDRIFVECAMPVWWQGAKEVIDLCRRRLPDSQITLIGGYPALAEDRARHDVKPDRVARAARPDLGSYPADLTLYAKCPSHCMITIAPHQRDIRDVTAEIMTAYESGVRQFAFAEHGLARDHYDLFERVLAALPALGLRAHFYALGNVYANDLVERPDLARLLRDAGFSQLNLADDREVEPGPAVTEELAEIYVMAATACHDAGFAQREDCLTAGVCVGRPNEDIAERATRATIAAHHVGAVILWPYQPQPSECILTELQNQSARLFPLRNGNTSYRDYMDLHGLGAILNAKYRQRTMDFKGDGLIAQIFQDRMAAHGWNPDPEVKGPLMLPVRA